MSLESKVIRMRTCDSNDERQRFTGSFDSSKFEIHPVSDDDDCLTQQHHPKKGEEVRLYSCSTARGDDTSYWNEYWAQLKTNCMRFILSYIQPQEI
jgi:hypothetical protein